MSQVKETPKECTLTVDLGPPSPTGSYVQDRIFATRLTQNQAKGLDLLWQACRVNKFEMDKTQPNQQWGKPIDSRTDALRWLLDRIADAYGS